MQTLLVAIHGILTSQTQPSWPDHLDAWMSRRDPAVKVLKKEYAAGPFPRWNCWVRDPRLARGLANEIELFLKQSSPTPSAPGSPSHGLSPEFSPPLWFVAHSNGAVIALLVTKRLVSRGYQVGGLILTGAACDADVVKNGVSEWLDNGSLGAAIAYCSHEDQVLDGDFRDVGPGRRGFFQRMREFLWGKLLWPYGCLGRTGWQRGGARPNVFTRWFPGGHSGYFRPDRIAQTFDQMHRDISQPLF